MRLGELTKRELIDALAFGQLRVYVGHFELKVTSTLDQFGVAFQKMYGNYPISISGGSYDYDIDISPPSFFRHWIRRNCVFRLSGDSPFLPMEIGHAHALFEWGLNWAIGSYAHNFLILHSAVLEKNGIGVIFAAESGSGKSTLAAELALTGWRLLSDEMALVDEDLRLIPCPRPVSLKNQSIEIIMERHPSAMFGPIANDTHKGTIAHLVVPPESIARSCETALPRKIVFPKWKAGADLRIDSLGSGQTALRLIDQSFNYPLLGKAGFIRLAELVSVAEAWEIEFSSLDDISQALDELVA
jgi:HprK-related kinase A